MSWTSRLVAMTLGSKVTQERKCCNSIATLFLYQLLDILPITNYHLVF